MHGKLQYLIWHSLEYYIWDNWTELSWKFLNILLPHSNIEEMSEFVLICCPTLGQFQGLSFIRSLCIDLCCMFGLVTWTSACMDSYLCRRDSRYVFIMMNKGNNYWAVSNISHLISYYRFFSLKWHSAQTE
jgi:hypothetical protein